MHSNLAMIEKFYSCFKELDGDGMAQCYHEKIEFSDPVFPKLQGAKVGAMWKMLCSQAQGFELMFSDIQAELLKSTTFARRGRGRSGKTGIMLLLFRPTNI